MPIFKASEPLVLALDTSSKTTSLAVLKGAELLKSICVSADEKRSERLWSEVQSLLAELGVTIANVDAFGVCVGPGGFTGLRIGMAAATGFAFALNKPIVGVTSLEAAAFAAGPAPQVCAMVNAYKNEVYSQSFSLAGEVAAELPVALNDPLVSTFEKALERISDSKEVIFTGEGAETGAELIEDRARTIGDVTWAIKRSDRSVAECVARIALARIAVETGATGREGDLETARRGDGATAAEGLRACYVRPAEAEIKLSLGLLGSKIKRSMKSD